ncbi:MAG: protein kinase domain-containing protein, partial [Chthoniobacterales bacterium]
MHEAQASAQTAGNCLGCGRPLTHRGPDGECLRCLLSLGFLADDEEPLAGRAKSRRAAPLRYAHFEVETGGDGYPVELGAGAMAVTYRARDTILHSIVALKVIDREMAENTAARARFLREARAAAQLHHPNIALVTHYGEQDGECFYAMEFIDGETLEERVRREGPLPLPLALEVTLQVARALAAAEACGVVHRDLKPSNLMIASRQGEADASDSLIVKVIDFGVAKVTDAGADQTQAGFIGTPVFASPEQFGVAGQTRVDTRSDIYSLGITLWYLLTGRTPFTGRTLEEIRARQSEEPPLDQLKATKIPAQVVALLKSMLSVDPAARPQSARELLVAVLRCYKGEQQPPSAVEAAARQEEGFWVAVLPFKFSGANSEIALLSEWLNEEIITGLSRFPYLRVIARSSTARYATESIDVRRAGHELGARYILEGSLRQTESNLRIAVQLVDTDSGAHLWAETFDRDLQKTEILQLQDAIADRVVTTVGDVYGVLARAIAAMTRTKQPKTLTPYEAVWRFFLAQQRGSAEDHLSARRALEHAVELQPTNADVWAALAVVIIDEDRHGFNSRPDSLDRALRAAERAIDADPASQMANFAFAEAQYFRGDLGAFRAAAERALALNSRCSYTIAHLGLLFCLSGDWEKGLQLATRAIDLCPHHPGWYCYGHFFNEYRQRHYAEALAILQQINMPDFWGAHYFAAMTQAQLGNPDAARAEVERTLEMWPDFEATFGRKHLKKWIRNQPDLIAHVIEGVELAGFRLSTDGNNGDEESLGKNSERQNTGFAQRARSPLMRLRWVAVGTVLVMAAIIAGLWFLNRTALPPEKEASVAVLPFENLSPASEDSFFTVGMQDEISADLARIKALKVIGPESTQDYVPGNRDFARISHELGVSHLVTGSVRRENGKMRVAVRLIDPLNKVSPWTKEYE